MYGLGGFLYRKTKNAMQCHTESTEGTEMLCPKALRKNIGFASLK